MKKIIMTLSLLLTTNLLADYKSQINYSINYCLINVKNVEEGLNKRYISMNKTINKTDYRKYLIQKRNLILEKAACYESHIKKL